MMSRLLAAACTALCVGAARAGAQPSPQTAPDLVLTGGKVFTADPTHPWVEALAIRGERILAVGTSAEMRRLAGRATREIALGGRVVIPGINDAHTHFGWVRVGVSFDVTSQPTPDPPFTPMADSLAALARRVPEGTWISTSVGPTVLDDTSVRRAALDRIAPRHPVWLDGRTGHGAVVNSAGLRVLGIVDTAADPLGGWYEREPGTRRVSGRLDEYAGWVAKYALFSAQPESAVVAQLRAIGRDLVRFGITSVQNMSGYHGGARMMRLFRAAELPVRVRVIAMPMTAPGRRLAADWEAELRRGRSASQPSSALTVSGVKWILDGTLLERLAAVRAPYADRQDLHGRLNFAADTVRAMLAEARSARRQLLLHAVGDSTIALVLVLMEEAGGPAEWRRARLRIEHSDGLTPDLRERARRLGVVVVQNPSHFAFPEVARQRLGPAAVRYQPVGSLVRQGIPLALGSDGPLNPFLSIMLATTHPNNPAEVLSREEAVAAYTRGSAYAEFAEREKGTLAAGMLADLAVLSQDIFTVRPDGLPATTSVLTIVGGRIVRDALTRPAASTAPH